MKNKKKNNCNGGWDYGNKTPRAKLPPNKTIPDQKKKNNKEKGRERIEQYQED